MQALASLLLLLAVALAGPPRGPWYLEGPAEGARSDAAAIVRQANASGWKGRVVRRFSEGSGWRYVAVIEGFADQASASAAARTLTKRTGASVAVFTSGKVAGAKAHPAAAAPASASPAPAPASTSATSGAPAAPDTPAAADAPLTVAQWLERSVRAHGGPDGGLAVVQGADHVLFRFRRHVPDGPVVEHTWARNGQDLYVQVDIVKGQGVSSKTWLIGHSAWLATGDGPPTPQDPTRVREALERFSPEQTIGFPLEYARAAGQRPELQLLHRDGQQEVDGVKCERLRYDGDRGSGAIALAIDPADYRVREVVLGTDADPVVHRYSDYRDLGGGLVVPFDIHVWHGDTLSDEVEVLQLDVAPQLPPEWFKSPSQ